MPLGLDSEGLFCSGDSGFGRPVIADILDATKFGKHRGGDAEN